MNKKIIAIAILLIISIITISGCADTNNQNQDDTKDNSQPPALPNENTKTDGGNSLTPPALPEE